MEQREEENGVPREFKTAKADGRQGLCPQCQKPLQTEQPQYVSNYWQWNNKKRYERDESGPSVEEPFCAVCRAEHLHSLYR